MTISLKESLARSERKRIREEALKVGRIPKIPFSFQLEETTYSKLKAYSFKSGESIVSIMNAGISAYLENK